MMERLSLTILYGVISLKKKKKLQKHENLVVFPGTGERLLQQAHFLAENYQYDQANLLFEEAFQFTEGDEMSLSVYAYSLYEAKAFEKAKGVCEQLLAIGPLMYFEAMELYLTVCMQLRQFKQVEKIIESLLEEGAIPDEQLEKFERLKNLNADIAENISLQQEAVKHEIEEELFDCAEFLEKEPEEQLLVAHELTTKNIRPIVDELKFIIESQETHPFIKSVVLILLVEQQVSMEVTIEKFDRALTVNPANLQLPTKLPQFQKVSELVLEQLDQEPSTLELVQYMIAKHAIVTYPFEWLDYDSEDVATSYGDFVHAMFGKIQETDYEIYEFLQILEKMTELQHM